MHKKGFYLREFVFTYVRDGWDSQRGFTAIKTDLGQALDAQSGISSAMCSLWRWFSAKADRFVHVTVAGPLRKFVKLLFTSDKMVCYLCFLPVDYAVQNGGILNIEYRPTTPLDDSTGSTH